MATTELREVPGPRGVPFIGNVLDLDMEAPLASMLSMARDPRYCEVFSMTFNGQKESYITCASLLDEISDEKRFKKLVHSSLEKLRPAVGSGLFTAHNDEVDWAIAHRILMPVFGPIKIREMFPQMQDLAVQLCLKWARQGESVAINASDDFTRLTLDTIGLCAMGTRFNSFYDTTAIHAFVGSMVKVLAEADTQAMLPDFINSLRIPASTRFQKHVGLIRATSEKLVQQRRANPTSTPDLLNAMLNGRDPKTGKAMSDESIVDNMGTFLIAGHETTSGLLSFAFYYMTSHPDVIKRAQDEIDDVVGSDRVNVHHLGQLPYITAILRETLRLQPTAPGWTVSSDKDEVLGQKFKIKAGQPIVAFLHAVHRDSQVYGPDADEFRPERMLDDKFGKLPPGAWKPFGNGSRSCIGRAFAWQEALLTVAMILQNFDVRMADEAYTLKTKETLTVKPDGFFMSAKLRRHAEALDLATFLGGGGDSHTSASSSIANDGALKSSSSSVVSSKPFAIYHASNTGTCAALAQRMMRDLQSLGCQVSNVSSLQDAVDALPRNHTIIIFTASYDGQPADEARAFVSWLESLKAREKESQPGQLKGVQFAVFGCGHRDWPNSLHRIPRLVDDLLETAGATRVAMPCFVDSATSDLFSDLEDWTRTALLPHLGRDPRKMNAEHCDDGSATPTPIPISIPHRLQSSSSSIKATVSGVKLLTLPGAVTEKMQVDLQVPGTALPLYTTGGHVVIMPFNPIETVNSVLQRFNISWDTSMSSSTGHRLDGSLNSMTTGYFLRGHVELSQPATSRDIQLLASTAQSEETRAALLEHHATKESYQLSRRDHQPRPTFSILDLLEQYPDISLDFGRFVERLQSLRPRTYSISSAPPPLEAASNGPLTISLTFSVLSSPNTPSQEPSSSSKHNHHLGVASTYLSRLTSGDTLEIDLKPRKPGFQLPSSLSPSPSSSSGDSHRRPIVLITHGSGLAPFRGFLQELEAMANKNSNTIMPEEEEKEKEQAVAALFLGCRDSKEDIYREELDAMQAKGLVGGFRVFRAYSRKEEEDDDDDDDERRQVIIRGHHVQEALRRNRELLKRLWGQGGKFMVCGSLGMEREVRGIVMEIAGEVEGIEGGGDGGEGGEEERRRRMTWFDGLGVERYVAEVFTS